MSKKEQIHKRIALLYMKDVFDAYWKRIISLPEGIEALGLGRSNFFRYLKMYHLNPEGFNIAYSRKKNRISRFSLEDEQDIEGIIKAEKKLIEDENVKVSKFNFHALSDDLLKYKAIAISPETLRRRAIGLGLYKPKQKGVRIYREVETMKIGRLFQHDACLHQWSPYMKRFYLILTVDDHSRRIVYAKFFHEETSMNHILAVRDTVLSYGLPVAYYTDRHSIFTFNRNNGPHKRTYQIEVEDAEVQWKRVMNVLQIQQIYAQSPQAKGKVESKFRYLQGRMVRRCAKEEVRTIEHAQRILNEEITYYNEHKKHEITGQTPKERWEIAAKEGRNLLRPLTLKQGQSWKDVFCLEYAKTLNPYGKCKVKDIEIQIKKASSKKVIVRLLAENGLKEIRIFEKGLLLKVFKI